MIKTPSVVFLLCITLSINAHGKEPAQHLEKAKASVAKRRIDYDPNRFAIPVESLEFAWRVLLIDRGVDPREIAKPESWRKKEALEKELIAGLLNEPKRLGSLMNTSVSFKLSYPDWSEVIREWNIKFNHNGSVMLPFPQARYEAAYRVADRANRESWQKIYRKAERNRKALPGGENLPPLPKHPENLWLFPR